MATFVFFVVCSSQIVSLNFACAQAVTGRQRAESLSHFGYYPRPDFIAYDPQYVSKSDMYKDELTQLKKKLFDQASKGIKNRCARQVLVECDWLCDYTAYFDRISKRLDDLRDIIDHPEKYRQLSDDQSPIDGSFNPYNQLWFYKVDVACDNLVVMQYLDAKPQYKLRFLDKINSPEKYRTYMDSVLTSDISHTGENTGFELNIAGSDLVRLISGSLPSGYNFDPELRPAMIDYLDNKWQDPATGFWGCWYKTPEGIHKTADLSCTFHIIHYRHGHIHRWPQILNTLFAMKPYEWPFGWLQEGQFSDHHNYDVVTIFSYGWRYMSPVQKAEARADIRQMLDCCLHQSLRLDGSFNMRDEDTIGESFEFPVLFLYEIGYFNKENRFWTNDTFPEAPAVAKRIAAKIQQIGLDDPESDVALGIVQSADQ